MLLLCIDSSAAASVAVVDAGAVRVLARWETQDTRSHAEVLTSAVDTTLREAGVGSGDLGGILVGTGPGPFTGLRAGLVTARTLGFAWHLPVYGMCSLDAVAHEVAALPAPRRPGEFAVATDARRRELYWATYRLTGAASGSDSQRRDDDGARAALVDGPHVGPPEDLPNVPVYGRGAGLYPERLHQPVVVPVEGAVQSGPAGEWQPAAASLGLAAAAVVASGEHLSEDTSPLYLRESDAKVPGPRKKATA